MIAIIPARSGSKGLPNKNIMFINGKPLIAWTIEAAINAQNVDRVIVSTDSHEIASVAKEFGAEVPFLRPSSISGDKSPILETYLYVLNRLENDYLQIYESFVALQPTSPLRSSCDIDAAIDLFKSNETNSVLSLTQLSHPLQWIMEVDDAGRIANVGGEFLPNRQDYKNFYKLNGAVYVYKKSLIRQYRIYDDSTIGYVMPANRSIDVDSIDDFHYAEYCFSKH